jgi:hypothetical protein
MQQPFYSIYSHGFIHAAVGIPFLRIAGSVFNVEQTLGLARRASAPLWPGAPQSCAPIPASEPVC